MQTKSNLRAQSRGDSGFARVLTMLAMMLLFLTTGATSAMADNVVVLKADPVTVANGEEAEIEVKMDYTTEKTLVGLSFSLYLPDGILLKGFDTKEAQDAARASALKKAFDIFYEEGIWGEDGTAGWLAVKPQVDGGLQITLIDQDDKTPFVKTHAPVISVYVHAVADVANVNGTINGIKLTDNENNTIDNIADVTFGINKGAAPEEPAVEAGTVTLADGTEDADKWQGKAGDATEFTALPLEGVAEGTKVTLQYNGSHRVKSVTAVVKGAAMPVSNTIYSWESPSGTPIETGGTIAYVNGDGDRLNYLNSGNYTICLNGKIGNIGDETASANAGRMDVTLDNALAAGDVISITGYITKNETKKASAYIIFNGENGFDNDHKDVNVESEFFSDEANIDATFNGSPKTVTITVPAEAAGCKNFSMTRGQTGTNLFITKLEITKGAANN